MRTRTSHIRAMVAGLAFVIFVGMTSTRCAHAVILLEAVRSGQHDEIAGQPGPADDYIVGRDNTGASEVTRNFFVFDLTNIVNEITSAELRLFNPSGSGSFGGYQSPDSAETYTLFELETSLADLGNVTDVSIYEDLGSDTVFGQVSISNADNGQFVEIPLNSDALASLNTSLGSDWGVGGAITTLSQPAGTFEYAFGFTNDSTDNPEWRVLAITTIPEPMSLLVWLLIGLSSAFGIWWRNGNPTRRCEPCPNVSA